MLRVLRFASAEFEDLPWAATEEFWVLKHQLKFLSSVSKGPGSCEQLDCIKVAMKLIASYIFDRGPLSLRGTGGLATSWPCVRPWPGPTAEPCCRAHFDDVDHIRVAFYRILEDVNPLVGMAVDLITPSPKSYSGSCSAAATRRKAVERPSTALVRLAALAANGVSSRGTGARDRILY